MDRILAAINLREARPGAGAPQHGLLAGQERRHHRLRGHERSRPGRQGLEGLQPEVPARRLGRPAAQHRARRHVRGPRLQALLLAGPRRGGDGQLSVQRERVDARPRTTTTSSPTPPTTCCAPTCRARWARSAASPASPRSSTTSNCPSSPATSVPGAAPRWSAGLKQMTAAAEAVNDWANVVFPVMGEVDGPGLPAVTPAAAPRRRSTSWATRCAAPRASSWTCSGSPDKVLAACERLVQVAVDWALKRPGVLPTPVVLHAAAQGRRRLHERRAVPHLLLADVARSASSVSSSRA